MDDNGVRSAPRPITLGHPQRTLKPGQLPRRRVHSEHLMGLLLAADGQYELGPDRLVLGSPVMWYLPAGEEEFINLHGQIHGWWVGFSWPEIATSAVEDRRLSIALGGEQSITTRWKPVDALTITRVVERFIWMDAAMARPGLSGALTASGLTQQLFAFYLQLPEGREMIGGHRALERFHDLLVQHAFDNVSIEELAQRVDMSADHLRMLFPKRWGMRPTEYRKELRLGKARELLLSSNMNVKQVARAVGYEDQMYFSRVFHERFKLSPRDMIRRYRLMVGG